VILDLKEDIEEWRDRYHKGASDREIADQAEVLLMRTTTSLSALGLMLVKLLPEDVMERLDSDDDDVQCEAMIEALEICSEMGGATDE